MIHKKLLLLSTYPIAKPAHGGQKRTRAIYDIYKENFEEVVHSAVFFKGFYSDYDKTDIPLGHSGEALVRQSPLTGDIVCGEAIYQDETVKQKMTSLLKTLRPDIIHIEQPFPYLGLQPLLAELNMTPKIVFGSQNIEAPMKREILEAAEVPRPMIAEVEAKISRLESDLSKASDLVVTCTEEDTKAHKAMGAKRTVLAPNGIAPLLISRPAQQYWQRKFQNMGVSRTVLFVGSAHPPNWTGFLEMVGKGLGFVPIDSRIVIAGSISDYFDREIKADTLNIEDATFWLRAFSAGRLSEERLAALISLSDVIILPITEGGGSNLKTAEAILADKKVVTTSHALRSFEWFRKFPNVWVTDSPATFRDSIVETLEAPFIERTSAQKNQANQVEWHNCLGAMVKTVAAI